MNVFDGGIGRVYGGGSGDVQLRPICKTRGEAGRGLACYRRWKSGCLDNVLRSPQP